MGRSGVLRTLQCLHCIYHVQILQQIFPVLVLLIYIGSITALQTSENVEVNSDIAAASAESCEMVQPVQPIVNINKVHMTDVCKLRNKLRRYQKRLYNTKKEIRIYRQKIKKPTRAQCTTQIKDQTLKIDFEEGIATAEIVNFFNDLFDSVNGVNSVNSVTVDNNLQSPVTEESVHHEFWANAKNVLRNMTFIDKVTHKIQKNVPSVKNWLFTIDGFQKIWNILNKKYDFKFFNTRFCNQDPLENLFGQIRSHRVRNVNPTPRQFEDSFITLLVSNMKSFSIKGGARGAVPGFAIKRSSKDQGRSVKSPQSES
ncbi:uncharacterized protein [Temnothorax longispinosus]|uniref:uncharacterized protein n=1 Tax=Temnothorax longispinosus TaxID=300112 RepID=UPI003A9A2826